MITPIRIQYLRHNQTNLTIADPTVYEVKLVYNPTLSHDLIDGSNPFTFSVFPNPTFNDSINIKFSIPYQAELEYIMSSVEGKILSEGIIEGLNIGNNEMIFNLEEAKTKIISYYSTNCDFIIKDAQTLVKQQKYDEAIYQLSLVPDVCQDCYFKCLDTLTSVYQQKIDADCEMKFKEAKLTWGASQNPAGAEKAGDILELINPMASCQTELSVFMNSIDAKLKADEKARWEFKMKQYADKIAAHKEQVRIAEEKGKRDDTYRENQSKRNLELDKIK